MNNKVINVIVVLWPVILYVLSCTTPCTPIHMDVDCSGDELQLRVNGEVDKLMFVVSRASALPVLIVDGTDSSFH